jgi:hypothetical protein
MPGDCSLRQALAIANGNGDASNTIVVPASSQHYALPNGVLTISKSLTLAGGGAPGTVIEATTPDRVFIITAGDVTIKGVTITGGRVSGSGGLVGGAGIRDVGTSLTVTDSVFSNNAVTATAASMCCNGGGAIFDNATNPPTITGSTFINNTFTLTTAGTACCNGGGAIYDDGSVTPQTLTNDTFSGNTASFASGDTPCCNGGGAYFNDGGPLTITQSTFNANKLTFGGVANNGGGGAIYHDGGDFTVTNSTFTDNTDSPSGGGTDAGGGAIFYDGGTGMFTNDTIDSNSTDGTGGNIFSFSTATFKNTIIASGSAPSNSNCAPTMAGSFASGGHNIEDSTPSQCAFGAAGDKVGVNPLLGPLQSNGGATHTQELLAGSPAIDAGDNSGCPATDQRGLARPQGPACDIGAVEVEPPTASTGPASGVGVTSATVGGSAANPNTVIGASVFFEFGTTASYGSQTSGQQLAPGTGSTAFSATITHLVPGRLYHYRIVASSPDGTSIGPDATFTTAVPTLSGLGVSPHKFSLSGRLVGGRCVKPTSKNGHHKQCKRPIKLRISYTLSAATTVIFMLKEEEPGRKVKGRCVKPTSKNKNRRHCTRLVALHGQITQAGVAGGNSFTFNGQIGGHTLAPGTYQLIATPAGGPPGTATFTIMR